MKIDHIVLIEAKKSENFYPFSIMHCIWEIRSGALRIYDKLHTLFPEATFSFIGREKHIKSFLKREKIENHSHIKGKSLIIYANYLITTQFLNELENFIEDYSTHKLVLKLNNEVIGAYLPNADNEVTQIENEGFFANGIECEVESGSIINYLWDAIYENGKMIEMDFQLIKKRLYSFETDQFKGVFAENTGKILVGTNCKISPLVYIDASKGAVIIDDNVTIMSQSTLIGPLYIGKNSIVKVASKIYQDTSIGQFCKVGGEIENSIIHAYSNKQHEGFLGHSYISEWVNLGADTNTSDLKNTYSEITMNLGSEAINTGRMFLGLLCGDHTKSAINSQFNTGTTAGICGILVKEGFFPNAIPSFAWGGKAGSMTYKLSKAIEVARIVMARRGKELSEEEIELMTLEHNFVTDTK